MRLGSLGGAVRRATLASEFPYSPGRRAPSWFLVVRATVQGAARMKVGARRGDCSGLGVARTVRGRVLFCSGERAAALGFGGG